MFYIWMHSIWPNFASFCFEARRLLILEASLFLELNCGVKKGSSNIQMTHVLYIL
jgi:hypothetical protein